MLLSISCNSNQNHRDHSSHVDSISLNDGHKWQVNAEMKPFLESGAQLVKDYISKESNAFKELAQDLKAQNDSLISSCTMKGESHEELHKWLHPHLELVKELSRASSVDEADEIVARLEGSYHTYQMFFE